MKKHFLLIGCSLLFSGLCAAQFGGQQDLAPALEAYRKSVPDTGRVNLLMQIGNIYIDRTGNDKNDLDSATLLITQAKDLSRRLGYTHGIDHSNRLLGQVMLEKQDFISFYRLMPILTAYDRQDLAISAAVYLLDPPDRTPGRVDTAFLLVHRCLLLSKKDTLLYDQVSLLVHMALIRYLNGNIGHKPPPSAAWTEQTVLSGGKNWLDPLLDWVADELRNDELLTADLSNLRARLRARYGIWDQGYMLENLRNCFIQIIGNEASNSDFRNRPDLAGKEFTLAVDFDRTGPQIELVAFYNIAYFYILQGSLQTALRYGLEAIRDLDKEKQVRINAHLPYYILGKIYYELHQPQMSVGYFRQGLARLKAEGLTPSGLMLSWMTDTWLAVDSASAALSYLRDSIHSGTLLDTLSKRFIADAIGECYYALGQYDKAQSWYMQAWTLSEKLKHYHQMNASFYLGKIYMRTRQYDKARACLEPVVLDSTREFMSIGITGKAHYLLFQADSATGNYASAISHLQAFRAINDSIFDRAKNDEIENLTIQYASDKKDKDILLQQAALRQSSILRNALVAGALLLALLLALVYNRYRIKHKSNRLLEERQGEIDSRNQELEHVNQKLEQLNHHQQRLLGEKEWLMREIHHRVKNNLQIILSLLNMQAAELKDDLALSAFVEASSRLRAISLIHQKLYQENADMTVVSMPEYVAELVGFLQDSFKWGEEINFRLEVERITLDVAQCVPIGLILNEAITNSIKHAFPEITKAQESATASWATNLIPEIFVALRYAPDDWFELVIADNGRGLSPQFDINQCESMGMELIRSLSEQLDGTMSLDSRQGLSIFIHFPLENAFGSNGEQFLVDTFAGNGRGYTA